MLKEEDPEKGIRAQNHYDFRKLIAVVLALHSSSIRILVHQISYEDVEKLFRTDPKGISNRKIIHKWKYPILAKANLSTCEKCKADLEIKSSPIEKEMFNVIGKIHGQLEPGKNEFLPVFKLFYEKIFFI